MIINYRIDENDFLMHQLFAASKSARIKKTRQRNRLFLTLIYLVFAAWSFVTSRYLTGIIFSGIAILWFFIYPVWESHHYIRHYKAFIKENYRDRFGKEFSFEFGNDFIIAKENGSESKILTTELVVINEIAQAIFLRLKGGAAFILTKDKIADIDSVKERLKELAAHLGIKYEIEENWKWK